MTGPEEGGDAACWLDRACPACGALADGPAPARCPRCGAAPEQGDDDGEAAPGR